MGLSLLLMSIILRTLYDNLRVSKRLLMAANRALKDSGLSKSEREVLLFLSAQERTRDVDLAKTIGMDRPQLSRTVNPLIERGIVKTEPYPRHRAQRLLSLSNEGRRLTQEIDAQMTNAFQAELKQLDHGDRALIMVSLDPPESSSGPVRADIHLSDAGPEDLSWLMSKKFANTTVQVASQHKKASDRQRSISGTGLPDLTHDEAFERTRPSLSRSLAEMSAFIDQAGTPVGKAKCLRHGNQRIGICLLQYGTDPLSLVRSESTTLWISHLYVVPTYRDKGYEDILLRWAVELAGEAQAGSLASWVREDLEERKELFKDYGFQSDRFKTERHSNDGVARNYRVYSMAFDLP